MKIAQGGFHYGYSSPLTARFKRGRGSFSDPQCENLVEFLEGKLRKDSSLQTMALRNFSVL